MAIEWERKGCDTKKGYWITAEGKKYRLDKMSDEHIDAAIDYIRTNGGVLRQFEINKIDELTQEIVRRLEEGKDDKNN